MYCMYSGANQHALMDNTARMPMICVLCLFIVHEDHDVHNMLMYRLVDIYLHIHNIIKHNEIARNSDNMFACFLDHIMVTVSELGFPTMLHAL